MHTASFCLRLIIGLLGVLCLSSCTKTLLIERVVATPPPTKGVPYFLRFTQFSGKITWRLVACATDTSPVKVAVEATTPTADYPVDPTQEFRIYPDSLQGDFNTYDFKIEYEAGQRPKSLNVTVEDRTSQTIAAAAGLAGQLVNLAAIHGFDKSSECETLLAAANAGQERVASLTRRLEARRARALALAANPAITEAVIEDALQKVDQVAEELSEATLKLAYALAAVKMEKEYHWPGNGNDTQWELKPDARVFVTWGGTANDTLADVRFEIAVHRGEATPDPAPTAAAPDLTLGLPIRVARPGALTISVNSAAGTAQRKTIGTVEAPIVQSGQITHVKIENGIFRSSVFSVAWLPSGEIGSIGQVQKVAPAEAVLTLAKGVADTAAATTTSVAAQGTKALQDEVARLTALKSRADLRAALQQPTPEAAQLKAIQNELTLRQAQLQLAQTNAALAALGQQ